MGGLLASAGNAAHANEQAKRLNALGEKVRALQACEGAKRERDKGKTELRLYATADEMAPLVASPADRFHGRHLSMAKQAVVGAYQAKAKACRADGVGSGMDALLSGLFGGKGGGSRGPGAARNVRHRGQAGDRRGLRHAPRGGVR